MNGRIYDAKLGRFLQADPFIQAASNTQSYNRYSYVMNNPLNATDPSGFFFKSLWNKIRPYVGAVVGIVLSIWCQGCGLAAYAAIGGVSGAVGAAANGGNILRGALTGAISAAAFYGIGQAFSSANCPSCFDAGKLTTTARVLKTASHAMAGGVMSVLQGGKFGHGFAAAGFTQAFARGIDAIGGDPKVNPTAYFSAGARVARIIVAATVGGTASKISGGKFANGAVTAAFSRGFNDEAHAERLDELAIEALDKVNPKSIRINREFGGLFYKTKEGELGYTPAVIGDEDGVLPGSTRSLVPEGAEVIGDYHTHAHYSTVDSAGNVVKVSSRALDTFNSDYFSNADLNSSRDFAREIPGYRSYLGTPSGHYLKYELIDGGDVVFQIK